MATDIDNKDALKLQIKTEWQKCYQSPEYFILKYVKIQHPQKGTIPFGLFHYQRNLLKEFLHRKYLLILKSRQLGLTTLIAAYCLWLMLFQSDKNILFISIKQDVAKDAVSKIKFSLDKLPAFLKLHTVERNRLSLKFTNGSQIAAVSSAGDSGRSKSLSLLVLDEAAHLEQADSIWASSFNTLSTGGSAIVLSTPNGVGNWFHGTWVKAQNGENDFYTLVYRWDCHPDRTKLWRDGQTKQLGEQLAAQECDASFLSSGTNVIDLKLLLEYEKEQVCEPIAKELGDCLWIWERAQLGKRYCLFIDTASGTGPDYSVCHVFDIDNCVQVAEYKGKLETNQFGKLVVELAKRYADALIIIEREAYGDAVIQQIKDQQYPYVFHSESEMRLVESDGTPVKRDRKTQIVPGVKVTSATRPRIIETLIQYFTEKSVVIRSNRLLNELRTFVWKNNKAQAAMNFNDDLVMALGIGLWVRDAAICRTEHRAKPVLSILPVTVETGSANVEPSPSPQALNQWQWRLGRETENLAVWLG